MSEPNGVAPTPRLGGGPNGRALCMKCSGRGGLRDPRLGEAYRVCPDCGGHGYPTFDLIAHLHAQRAWSLETFGPGAGETNAAFERYADAALSGPGNDQDLDEIAGMLTVLLDGAMRAGHEPEAVAAALAEKLRVNQSRRWPAPGSVPEGEAVEHAKLCGTCHEPADEPSRFCSSAVHSRDAAKEGGE